MKESASTADVVVLALTVAAGIFGLATAAVQFLGGRKGAVSARDLRSAVRVIALTTSPLQSELHQRLVQKSARKRPVVMLILALACLCGLFIFEWTRPEDPNLTQALGHFLGSTEFLIAIVLFVWIYTEIRGVPTSDPVRSRFVEARLEGDFSPLADRCQSAAQAVSGFSSTGAEVTRSDQRFYSQTWIPGWFAYRLTVELTVDGSTPSVRIESANFWPFLFHERSNADHVRKALDAVLIESETPGSPGAPPTSAS